MEDQPNPFVGLSIEQAAAVMVGKYVLIGVTYYDKEGNEIRQQQFHGVIDSASDQGILIALRGASQGETWNMPPDLRGFRAAEPGRYLLHSTNEEIDDPDYTVAWAFHAQDEH
jgi:hypothetical protein